MSQNDKNERMEGKWGKSIHFCYSLRPNNKGWSQSQAVPTYGGDFSLIWAQSYTNFCLLFTSKVENFTTSFVVG